MKVLIVSRTVMTRTTRCIGGLTANDRSVRLLPAEGRSWSESAPFDIGEVWDLGMTRVRDVEPPHVEDVRVTSRKYIADQPDLADHLLGRIEPWRGAIAQVFGGLLGFTQNSSGYISESTGIPEQSTGYWIPDRDLKLTDDRRHYRYPLSRYTGRSLSYVGEPDPVAVIRAGTLVRVSLARWWRPKDSDMELRCYLQLSGWYA